MFGRLASVRARTTLLAVLLTGLTLTAASVLLVLSLDRSLGHNDDVVDRARVHDLARLAGTASLPRRLDAGGEGVAQVVGPGGGVIAASANVAGRGLVTSYRPPAGDLVVRTVRDAPDDDETETYRVWMLTTPTAAGPVTSYVGTSTEARHEATRILRGALLVGVPLLVALLGVATWAVIGRALRPVEDLRAEVATIGDDSLDRRVPQPPVDDEVGRLATTMNAMLARLETASTRQRAFVADASHELQSPLAALRTQLEVAVARPGTTDWDVTARDLLADTGRMERLVRDLLFLARVQDGPAHEGTLLDLDDLVLEEVARLRPTLPGEVTVDAGGVSAAPVRGDADDLRRLVRNLLENAAHHARSAVTVRVGCDEHGARLDVCDDGPGVAEADRERVFDRFFRADPARDGAGTGLGLAIARAVAERHRGTVRFADARAGAHVVLTLPSAGA